MFEIHVGKFLAKCQFEYFPQSSSYLRYDQQLERTQMSVIIGGTDGNSVPILCDCHPDISASTDLGK